MDRKGLFSFLLLTFGITITVTIILWAKGFTLIGKDVIAAQLAIAGLMFVPGISAFITRKFVTKEGFKGLRLGNFKSYLKVALFIPLLFVIMFAITSLLSIRIFD